MIAHTAANKLAGYFEAAMYYWDAAPALLIARESGLSVSNFSFADVLCRQPVLVTPPDQPHLKSIFSL